MFERNAEEYVNTHVAPPFSISEQDLYDCFQRAAIFGYNKVNKYAKTIIQDLLDNSDEYARQRAMDFLEEVENEAD